MHAVIASELPNDSVKAQGVSGKIQFVTVESAKVHGQICDSVTKRSPIQPGASRRNGLLGRGKTTSAGSFDHERRPNSPSQNFSRIRDIVTASARHHRGALRDPHPLLSILEGFSGLIRFGIATANAKVSAKMSTALQIPCLAI